MARKARLKDPLGTYHIMLRGSSNFLLFKSNKDKDKFLKILKKYKTVYQINIYEYCLMDTHVHLLIYCKGADISKVMHSINLSYAMYYNTKYNRNGHVFGDRFKSKLIQTTQYLLACSAYIHNNPKDIKQYKNNVQNYTYSSLGIYLGNKQDKYALIDSDFILQHFSKDPIKAKKSYSNFLRLCVNDTLSKSFQIKCNSKYEDNSSANNRKQLDTTSERKLITRNYPSEQVIEFVAKYLNIETANCNMKHSDKLNEFNSLCVVLLRCLCDLNFKNICKCLNTVTLQKSYDFCNTGVILIQTKYKNIISEFIKKSAI
ncbi:transposase [Haloimpatiens sp. FM7330]|uniref:transposase n=1 Tax=Haloimpatiens sp. FM7330 TaxID=3298610 RepID=UPI00363A5002